MIIKIEHKIINYFLGAADSITNSVEDFYSFIYKTNKYPQNYM